MSHTTILTSIQSISTILTNKSLNEIKDIKNFAQWFLLKKRRFSIYLGAGASKTVYSWDPVDNDYVCNSKTWRDLLLEMYRELGDDREKFLKSASARVGQLNCLRKGARGKARIIQELKPEEWIRYFNNDDEIVEEVLDKLGPFRFAWSLRWFFSHNLEDSTVRNETLAQIVNKPINQNPNEPKDITKNSELLPEIVKLPFRDIITTNYDNYIEYFLDHEAKRRESENKKFAYYTVYDVQTLVKSFQRYTPRLFYLHGKAGTDSNLIFDKYDYAKLFSQNNQILKYLVGEFLRYSVLYIGFGLDDQTFDFMETQIKAVCERDGINRNQIPVSYAFIRHPEISLQEKDALKALFNIHVIQYDEYKDLPLILKNIYRIIEYTELLQIEWTQNPNTQKQVIKRLKKSGIRNYLNGNLWESLHDYERALRHTMFWECTHWDEVQQVCEIRRRLALIRSKLKLTDQQNQVSTEKRDVKEIIASHVEKTENLIKKFTSDNKNKRSLPDVASEQYALDMLKARLAYHDGEFSEALKSFNAAQHQVTKGRNNLLKASRTKIEKDNYDESDINLLETYYFAQCQIDRAEAMLESTPRSIDITEVARNAKEIHKSLKDSKTSDEKDLRIKEFGNIVVIATWALAYGRLREFGRFVDTGSEAKRKKNVDDLEEINALLEDGWDYAKCQRAYADPNPKHRCMPSPRWVTVKHRSRCRALALIWFNKPEMTYKLTDAYKSVQKALEITANNDDLKIQHIRNLLEAVRLNTLTNFVAKTNTKLSDIAETIVETSDITKTRAGLSGLASSPMCFAASYHYLKSAFKDIEELQKTNAKNLNSYIDWIKIQAYEISSVWKIVFQDFLKGTLNDPKPKLLDKFLKNKDDKQFVEKKYTEYGKNVLNDEKKVSGRINSFTEVFDRVYSAFDVI